MSSTITALTSGGGLAMAGDTSGQLELKTNNGTTAVTVTTAQNVGIGTTSPATKLQLGDGSSGTTTLRIHRGSGTDYTDYYSSVGSTVIDTVGGGNIGFKFSGTERFLMAANGRTYFYNNGGTATTIGDCIYNFAGTFSANRGVSFNSTDSATDGTMQYFTTQGTYRGAIVCSSGGTAYNSSSDYRLKDNVAPMQDALAKVALLKPVTYTWKETGDAGQGFIAHELQEHFPDAVTGTKDGLDKDGNPDYQGIDTSFLVATLTAAIQELNAKVDAQAAEIQALKGVA